MVHPTLGGKGVSYCAPGGMGSGAAKPRAMRHHRKLVHDSIRGITKNDIRRLARRGGVKRMSTDIYDDLRGSMKDYLRKILQNCVIFTDYQNRKTVTVVDVIFALKRVGRPIYGFDQDGLYMPDNRRGRT